MRTTRDLSAMLPIAVCEGGCGLSETRHQKGTILLSVVHYADRRLTVQTARTLLVLAAQNAREQDGGYLNNLDLYGFLYEWTDSVAAYRMGCSVGIRLPARVFDAKRAECRRLAAMRGVKLSRYRAAFQWATGR